MGIILVPVEVKLDKLVGDIYSEGGTRDGGQGVIESMLVQGQLNRVSIVLQQDMLPIDRLVKVVVLEVQRLVPLDFAGDDVDGGLSAADLALLTNLGPVTILPSVAPVSTP